MVDAITGQLSRACLHEHEITLDAGIDDLDDDILVREAHNQAVFGSVAASSVRTEKPSIAPYLLLVL